MSKPYSHILKRGLVYKLEEKAGKSGKPPVDEKKGIKGGGDL
jgi:hypothetical protein